MNNQLATYAINEKSSQGRKFTEPPHRYRSDFERDRDRIIHSASFRRLEGKTQVFTPGLNDHYRTRFTHTIEVAQIGRTIAKALNLNDSLTEAICLAHDLGHSPFGHNGEDILNSLTSDIGGFEHNRQSLRIVELLEHPYPDFLGLNLMYETRLGLAKHRSPYDKPDQTKFKEKNCSLEGQIADISDRIAYNCHDLEDGLRAAAITPDQLKEITLFAESKTKINYDSIEDKAIALTRTAKTIMNCLVSDCIETSKDSIANANIKTPTDVYTAPQNVITLSKENDTKLTQMESFLLNNFYLHNSVTSSMGQIKNWLTTAYKKLCDTPNLMPPFYHQLIEPQGLKRTVCDYIAGTTDRFCRQLAEEQ